MDLWQVNRTTASIRNLFASPRIPSPKRRVHDTSAAIVAVASRIRNVDEGTGERQIEQHAEEREECNAAQTADEAECQKRIQDSGSGDAFYGFHVGGDSEAMVREHGEEVGEYS